MGQRRRGIGALGIAAILLGLVAVGALVVIIGWPFFSGTDAGVSVGNIAARPDGYIGTRVTVDGTVANAIGPHAFTITEHEPFGEEVLVVSRGNIERPLDRPGALGVTAADTVEVTGTVRRFDLAAFERDLGTPFDLGDFADWEGKPAILADGLVVTTDGYRLVADPPGD